MATSAYFGFIEFTDIELFPIGGIGARREEGMIAILFGNAQIDMTGIVGGWQDFVGVFRRSVTVVLRRRAELPWLFLHLLGWLPWLFLRRFGLLPVRLPERQWIGHRQGKSPQKKNTQNN